MGTLICASATPAQLISVSVVTVPNCGIGVGSIVMFSEITKQVLFWKKVILYEPAAKS